MSSEIPLYTEISEQGLSLTNIIMLGYLVVLQSVALLSFASASASSLRGSKDFSAVSWAPHVQQVSRSAASVSASARLLWAPLDTMPHNMSAFATVETESGLVVSLGGYDSSADTPQRPDTYILDPTSLSQGAGRAQWKSSDSLLIGRTDMGSSLAPQLGEGIAMVIGGFTGSNVVDGVNYNTYTASCETLDTTTGKVVDLGVPDFPFENTGVAAAYLPNGQVVAVGGFGIVHPHPNPCFCPNPNTNPNYYPYAVGYHEDMSFFYSSATYVLTADSDSGALKWKEGPDYPWERSGLVCSSISTGILCAGGGETDPAYHNAAIFDG